MPLSFILHPPAEQMFISDAADEGGKSCSFPNSRRDICHMHIFLWSFHIFPPTMADWGLHGATQLRFAASVMVIKPVCRPTSDFSLVSISLRG